MATIGMLRRRASLSAVCSLIVSMIKTAAGSIVIWRMPPSPRISLRCSLSIRITSFFFGRLLGLLLGADEQDGAVGREPFDELIGLFDQRDRLVQVDDMDAVAGGINVALHLGIPALALVAEMDDGLEQFFHCNYGHGASWCLYIQIITRAIKY